jgi:hypothetical protein
VLQAEQRAKHIGVEGGGIALGGLVDGEARLAFGARVVDRGVQTAEAGHRLVDQIANFAVVTDVGLDEDGFGAELPKFGFERLALGLPAAGDDESGAVPREGNGSGAADACQGAGDEDDGLVHEFNSCEV